MIIEKFEKINCRKCGVEYWRSSIAVKWGRRLCVECKKEEGRRYYLINGKEVGRRSKRTRKEQGRVHRLVWKAIIRGKITRCPCVVCGGTKTEAHHEDYAKPFDITWLCRLHHKYLHAEKNGIKRNCRGNDGRKEKAAPDVPRTAPGGPTSVSVNEESPNMPSGILDTQADEAACEGTTHGHT